jgi:hypothetical protein
VSETTIPSELQIVDRADLYPNGCICCGGTVGPYVDWGRPLAFQPRCRGYVCLHCFRLLAHAAQVAPRADLVEATRQLRQQAEQIATWEAELGEAQAENARLTAALAGAQDACRSAEVRQEAALNAIERLKAEPAAVARQDLLDRIQEIATTT